MRTIPLSQGKVAIVDDEDYEALSQYKWCALKKGKSWYARRTFGPHSHQKTVYMHREILNAPLGLDCDHINGNGLDNRRCNLRFCTRRQNAQNQRIRGGASKFKGVYWDKRDNKWYARIGHAGKRYNLGYFGNEIDAARAYDTAAHEHFGEFARPNFPQ